MLLQHMGREGLLAALLTQLMAAWSKCRLKASGLNVHVQHLISVAQSTSLLQCKDFMAPGVVDAGKAAPVPLAAHADWEI